jgi:hypothetical protein
MPGLDGTGPAGRGPMTGRGFGRCRFGQVRRDISTPPERMQEGGALQEGQAEQQARETGMQPTVYGIGRGGIPWGCGRGYCGGRRRLS